ncbi:hypothetical protein [Coraliomargarita akajimensis]|uniref:Uncharacterized protein n=1 Tax=Coraliomargarita akajimensis (strain DSM 45221 / IAM 15411 / JCM 23193 / KCTC 12865 / 04OKA010-24) TaxID=583355 RepID=D5EKF1_CORAD|nr:hypothetical protein [Coraliomargarita akajimensis]ADE53032.1 conserved hypothetical protein [Coraliomargarita akajimensis DSM 45221]
MDITDAQKAVIAGWVQENKSLAEIQNLLREEFDISMTYMDVRFLVDDLELVFEEPEPEAPDSAEEADSAEAGETSQASGDAAVEEPQVMGGVSVELDAIMRPGAMVSGQVTFSDGVTMGWQVSNQGLGLVPGDDPEYRPSPEDIQDFQNQLHDLLQKQGY